MKRTKTIRPKLTRLKAKGRIRAQKARVKRNIDRKKLNWNDPDQRKEEE